MAILKSWVSVSHQKSLEQPDLTKSVWDQCILIYYLTLTFLSFHHGVDPGGPSEKDEDIAFK